MKATHVIEFGCTVIVVACTLLIMRKLSYLSARLGKIEGERAVAAADAEERRKGHLSVV